MKTDKSDSEVYAYHELFRSRLSNMNLTDFCLKTELRASRLIPRKKNLLLSPQYQASVQNMDYFVNFSRSIANHGKTDSHMPRTVKTNLILFRKRKRKRFLETYLGTKLVPN